jgi:hypothetical protein
LGYRGVFNSVKHAKNFVLKHFKGTANQEVYHQEKHHCVSATWGGRGKQAEVRITKAAPGYYRAQRDLYVNTMGKELSHRYDGITAVDVSRCQRMPGMAISEDKDDTRSTVVGPASLQSEVCRNLDRLYRGPKQTNLYSKEDVARRKEPPEDVARGGYPTVRGYGESTGPGQDTEDSDAKEPRRDTEDDAELDGTRQFWNR